MPKLRLKLFRLKKKRKVVSNKVNFEKLDKISIYRQIDSLFYRKSGGKHIFDHLSYKRFHLKLRFEPIKKKIFMQLLKEEVFYEYVHLIKNKKIKEIEDIDLNKFLKNISINLNLRIKKEDVFKIE